MRCGSLSSELLVCGRGVRSIVIANRCMYMVHVCFFMSVIVTVWGSVGMFVV